MALIRVFCRMDVQHKIILSAGVCKELKVKPGDKLELTVAGVSKAKKLIITKERRPSRLRLANRRCLR